MQSLLRKSPVRELSPGRQSSGRASLSRYVSTRQGRPPDPGLTVSKDYAGEMLCFSLVYSGLAESGAGWAHGQPSRPQGSGLRPQGWASRQVWGQTTPWGL